MIPFTWKPTYTYFAGGIVLLLSLFFAVNRVTSWYKDGAFEKQVEKYEEKLKVKEDERNAAVTRALMYEQLVEALEKEREINMAIIAASGERAVAAQKAVEDEEKKLQNEFDSIGIDVPDDVRADRIRQRLKRLYPAK
jgi:hypothetical protein